MSIILVFGASGAVGRFLLPQLAQTHAVIAVSRDPRPGDVHWIRGDLNDRGISWPPADIAISLGPLDAFAEWWQRYPHTALRRVIALSSMSAESKRNSSDPHERALAESLRAAESRLMATADERGAACTLFRPTLIYGAGTDRSLAPIARFARRWRLLPLPLGAAGLRQPVHARDLAGACASVIANAATFGKTYALGGGERLRLDAMLMRVRDAVPGFVLPLPLPLFALRLAARLRGLGNDGFSAAALARTHEPLIADNTDAARDFAYAPAPFIGGDVLPRRFAEKYINTRIYK